MAVYTIEPERSTLHGHFSCDLPPALTIDSGDTVTFRTLDAAWGLSPPANVDESPEKFEPREKGKDGGHALCGPVSIRDAKPGTTLEVVIDRIDVGAWGWSGAGGRGGERNKALGVDEGPEHKQLWELDTGRMVGRDQNGREVALRPFMGVMGMPPPESGVFSTGPPRIWGGNLDCKELVAGTTLFLPVPVEGGLFSTGDGHAVQGDGEVSGVAIECPMDRIDLTFHARDFELSTPRARTSEGWLTLGLDEDLNVATYIALNAMLDLMGEEHGMNRSEVLALASLVVDLRITQIVNGVRGVHACLPDGKIR